MVTVRSPLDIATVVYDNIAYSVSDGTAIDPFQNVNNTTGTDIEYSVDDGATWSTAATLTPQASGSIMYRFVGTTDTTSRAVTVTGGGDSQQSQTGGGDPPLPPELVGGASMSIRTGEAFVDPGTVSGTETVTGTVDTSVAGEYTLIYDNGVGQTVERKVFVNHQDMTAFFPLTSADTLNEAISNSPPASSNVTFSEGMAVFDGSHTIAYSAADSANFVNEINREGFTVIFDAYMNTPQGVRLMVTTIQTRQTPLEASTP